MHALCDAHGVAGTALWNHALREVSDGTWVARAARRVRAWALRGRDGTAYTARFGNRCNFGDKSYWEPYRARKRGHSARLGAG